MLVRPSPLITDPEQVVKIKALLFFTLAFIASLTIGIIKSPAFVRPALLVALPIVFTSYFIARTTHFKIAGLMSVFSTFLICFLLIFILDTESYYRHTALIWLTLTVFMGSLWMTFRSVIYLTIIQIIFAVFVAVFGKNMDLNIFTSWMPLNVFFALINLSTRWVLEQHHLVIHQNAIDLELMVDERTLELQNTLEEREELIKELYHRTKNNMQVIASLLVIQGSFLSDPESKRILNEMRTRILSMALVHEKLYQSKDLHAIEIKGYIESLVAEIKTLYLLDTQKIDVELDIERHRLALEKAVPIGLVLHELIVNMFKYAITDDEALQVTIICKNLEDGAIEFVVRDNGVGFPDSFDPNSSGTLGTLVIKNIIEGQLDGTIRFENDHGAKVTFQVPLGLPIWE